ncbi:MAG: arginine--tRNA ligase [Patescibacteria group bacterium]
MAKTVKQLLQEYVVGASGISTAEIIIPPDLKLGDYATNVAFILAKQEGKKPADVAGELKEKLLGTDLAKMADVEVAPTGFINFFLKTEFLDEEIKKDKKIDLGQGKKVIVEYSSPNIAKPIHIGHLRSTIIGDALANVYEKLGYEVVRWNFIGDWGTQFGKLIAADKKWHGNFSDTLKDPIQEMLRLYVKFHEELKNNPELEKEGQKEFKKLETGDEENLIIWKSFRSASLAAFRIIFNKLGIDSEKFVIKGESDYEPRLKPLIEELKNKGLAIESEGALIVELENMPPALLRKTDGATLYMTRDIASLEDRIQNYNPAKILYVVANQQALHFEQLFAVAKKLGWDSTELSHVKFGMVLGEDGKKLATREGKVVALQEVIDRITSLALETVKQKSADLSEEDENKIAHAVAISALKYNDLKQHPHTDIQFDWKAMLDLSGNSGPYIQYTYARLANILSKAGNGPWETSASASVDLEGKLIERKLVNYLDVLIECTTPNALNGLALYLYDLSALANRFYENVRVLDEPDTEKKNARLNLIKVVADNLKDGLGLLGIQTLERI